MSNRGIEFRRSQYARIKAKRVRHNYWGYGTWRDNEWNIRALGMCIDTPKVCSCYMCGNARKLEGDTLQERRSELDFLDC